MKIFEVNYSKKIKMNMIMFARLLDKYNFRLVQSRTCFSSNVYIVRSEDVVWLTDSKLKEPKKKLKTSMIAKGNIKQLLRWFSDKENNNVLFVKDIDS